MKMKNASILFLVLAIAVSATLAFTADAQLSPGMRMPASTGFSPQGQLQQGMQTGAFGQGAAGGVAGGLQTVPGILNPGPQQGAGIWIGEGDIRPTGTLPGGTSGGAPTCQCIRAPCYCPTSGGSPPPTNFPNPNQPVVSPPLQTQPLQIPAGTAGNVPFGSAASGGVQPRQF